MSEFSEYTNKKGVSQLLAELSSYTTLINNLVFSPLTMLFFVASSILFAYILGKRANMKNVIIDTNLKANLENVEEAKKKLKKKMGYWLDLVDMTKRFIFFLSMLIVIYAVLYYINPEYVQLVQHLIKNAYFVQGCSLLFIFFFCFISFAKYKQNIIQKTFNKIDKEAQSLFEDILNKMGSKLTKSMTEALIKKRVIKEMTGFCKKEICKKQKAILEKKAKNAQGLLAEIGKFQWCPMCSSDIEFRNSANSNINQNLCDNSNKRELSLNLEDGKKMEEIDETKSISNVEQIVQTEEYFCNQHCGKRYFMLCREKGMFYKEQIDEISVWENQLKQMEAEFQKQNNFLK